MTSVEVLHADQWHPGTLDRWKHDERGWVGYVWWSEGPGLTHVQWIKGRPAAAGLTRGDAMHLWSEAMDQLTALEKEGLTLDQRIQLLQATALLSIAQEVSAIPDNLRQAT